MRQAFELAFSTAYLFAGSRPSFKMVDEIIFHKPVDIGNLLRFKSFVLYSEMDPRPMVHVEVSYYILHTKLYTIYYILSSVIDAVLYFQVLNLSSIVSDEGTSYLLVHIYLLTDQPTFK